MINAVLITGFLGAGKTTLMQEILGAFEDRKKGVIVNEFGQVSIDSALIKREGLRIEELSSGSIFCACIKDRFVDSLIEMSRQDIEYLFIEASGLADPSVMESILEGIRHKTGNVYDYMGSVCVVDGENFLGLYEILPALASQIEFCSAAVVNKIDLTGADELLQLKNRIRELNPDISIYETSFCKADIAGILKNMRTDILPEARGSSNTRENRPDTFVIRGEKQVEYDRLEMFIKEIMPESYRIKGFADTERGPVQISASGKHLNILPWKEKVEKTEIVVISAVGFRMMSVIAKSLEKNVKGILRV